MLENYFIKGLVIGIVFGVPAGAVGVLSVKRALTRGAFAGLMTGMGSSAADVFYAWVGIFGITMVSDFLLKHQRIICTAGCLMVAAIGIRTLRKKEGKYHGPSVLEGKAMAGHGKQPRHIISCFLSSFIIAIANPAAILSFMVVFSMFQIEGTETAGENVRLIFGIFCGTCLWWLAIAVIVSLLRRRITEDFYLKLNQVFGFLMVLFGFVIGVRGCLLR